MDQILTQILRYVSERRGVDFSTYESAFLEQQLQKRVVATKTQNYAAYYRVLAERAEELPLLCDALLIKFSLFFRDPLVFELLANVFVPQLAQAKSAADNHTLRIWSAGCANGEEPYSLAIILQEWLEQTAEAWNVHVFATDIQAEALENAKAAVYPAESLRHVKYGFLLKYFEPVGKAFRVRAAIRKLVSFSNYDLLDKKCAVPPESIFGDFDLVCCRNVLIYLNPDAYAAGVQKLVHAVSQTGMLVLGEAENLPKPFQYRLAAACPFGKMYRKR